MKERLNKLLSIKSIVTLLFVIVYLFLSCANALGYAAGMPDQLANLLGIIIAFYYGTQAVKE